MQTPTDPVQANESTPNVPSTKTITEPDFSGTPHPIEEFAVRPDFPQCALGAYLDIRGFAGVVVEIVGQSIKVISSEGITQRFNSYRLRTLCAPPKHIEPIPSTSNIDQPKPADAPTQSRPKPAEQPRVYIADPDFAAPVQLINDYAAQSGFPQCAYGKHVDIVGFTGVVVEIVKGSIKVQSTAGTTRSYNAGALKKIYGKA